jgi:hypothetical protein
MFHQFLNHHCCCWFLLLLLLPGVALALRVNVSPVSLPLLLLLLFSLLLLQVLRWPLSPSFVIGE